MLVLQVCFQGVSTEDVSQNGQNSQHEIEANQQTTPDVLPNVEAKQLSPNMPESLPQDNSILESSHEKTESSSSFPFGNLLKSIVDPMFEGESDPDEITIEDKEDEIAQVEKNETLDQNITNLIQVPLIDRDANNNKTEKKTKFKCISRNMTLENITSEVKIINNTRLLQILNFDKNDTLSDCVLVMFFAPWCRFCSKVAPNYNALARAFPELDVVAVDAAHFSK